LPQGNRKSHVFRMSDCDHFLLLKPEKFSLFLHILDGLPGQIRTRLGLQPMAGMVNRWRTGIIRGNEPSRPSFRLAAIRAVGRSVVAHILRTLCRSSGTWQSCRSCPSISGSRSWRLRPSSSISLPRKRKPARRSCICRGRSPLSSGNPASGAPPRSPYGHQSPP